MVLKDVKVKGPIYTRAADDTEATATKYVPGSSTVNQPLCAQKYPPGLSISNLKVSFLQKKTVRKFRKERNISERTRTILRLLIPVAIDSEPNLSFRQDLLSTENHTLIVSLFDGSKQKTIVLFHLFHQMCELLTNLGGDTVSRTAITISLAKCSGKTNTTRTIHETTYNSAEYAIKTKKKVWRGIHIVRKSVRYKPFGLPQIAPNVKQSRIFWLRSN